MIYLDNAATSLLKPVGVEQAMLHAVRTMTSPGRGAYPSAMRAAETLYDCRTAAAELFHVPDPEQVVLTMNATHALNIAIRSLARAGEKTVISGFEHNAVLRPLTACGCDLHVAGKRLFDPEDCLRAFAASLPGARLAVCTHVSNVFGYILPIAQIAALCRKEGVPLIVDASQSAGVLPIDFEALGAAFLAMPGHKGLYGPQGTGLLLCRDGGEPLLYGGSGSDSRLREMPPYLPDRLEAGTHNVCGAAGLLAGLRYVLEKGVERILLHEERLLHLAAEELSDSGLRLFCGPEGTQSGVLSLQRPGLDCEELAQRLSEKGICVRAGLHCAPLAHESAGTLETGTLRLSFSAFTAESELRAAIRSLREESGLDKA